MILPVFNAGGYLGRCLDSIFKQSYKNLEIIAINDGSTDSTELLLREYAAKDSRLKWQTIQNRGPAHARNCALSMASGTYVVFCDSDDEVPVSAYQSLIRCAERSHADAVVGRYYDRTDSGHKKLRCRIKRNTHTPFSIFFTDQILCNRLYRRSIIEDNAIRFPDQPLAEDTIFLAEYFVHCERITMVSDVVYHYFFHECDSEHSLSHTYTTEFLFHRISGIKQTIGILRRHQISETEQFIYEMALPCVFELFRKISQPADSLLAFPLVKDFVGGFEWERSWQRNLFEKITGLSVEIFQEMSAEEYLFSRASVDWKEAVLRQFQQGQIGFQYIIRYILAWGLYKLNHTHK